MTKLPWIWRDGDWQRNKGPSDQTDEDARTIIKAAVAQIREDQRTEVTEVRELLADIVQKAHPYGVQDGDLHRLLPVADRPDPPCDQVPERTRNIDYR